MANGFSWFRPDPRIEALFGSPLVQGGLGALSGNVGQSGAEARANAFRGMLSGMQSAQTLQNQAVSAQLRRKQMEALTPMRCLGTVEDIALGAIYLASPAGRWVTGKIFEIDGGTVVPNWPFDMRED